MVKILREQRSYAEIAKLQSERGSSVKLCGCGAGSFPFIMSLMVSQHSALGGEHFWRCNCHTGEQISNSSLTCRSFLLYCIIMYGYCKTRAE